MTSKRLIKRLGMPLILMGFLFLCLIPGASASGLLTYEEPGNKTSTEAVLYFRYQDSPYLVQETRTIQVEHTESPEKALVRALIDGPAPAGSAGEALIPEGTEVISVLTEGDTLFVTLSKEFQSAMPNEGSAQREDAVLRRRLSLSALANTLTETGRYQKVQVLIFDQAAVDASMRLSQRYFLEDNDQIPPPSKRQEGDIITPGKAAELILRRWQTQDWDGLISRLALMPGEKPKTANDLDVKNLPVLLSYTASPGTLAPDMTYALTQVTLEMKTKDGMSVILSDQTVKLLRQNNAWLMSFASLLSLTQAGQR